MCNKATSVRGKLKGEWCDRVYGAVVLQNLYLPRDVLYRGRCVFVLRQPMKCPTTFISGYPGCIIPEVHGGIGLI